MTYFMQVIIRIRPLNNSEISLQGHGKCVRQESSQTITWIGHPESRFTFDMVADENVTQVCFSRLLSFIFHVSLVWSVLISLH